MRMIIGAVLFSLATPTFGDEFDEDYIVEPGVRPVVFVPEYPPENAYEVFNRIEFGHIMTENQGRVTACFVYLDAVEEPADRTIPRDEVGQKKILLENDTDRFVSSNEVLDLIDPETCGITTEETPS